MATARRNKSFYKAKSMKSTNAFSVFDQAQIQEFKEAFNLIGFFIFILSFLFHLFYLSCN
jgi:hypothetical protein